MSSLDTDSDSQSGLDNNFVEFLLALEEADKSNVDSLVVRLDDLHAFPVSLELIRSYATRIRDALLPLEDHASMQVRAATKGLMGSWTQVVKAAQAEQQQQQQQEE